MESKKSNKDSPDKKSIKDKIKRSVKNIKPHLSKIKERIKDIIDNLGGGDDFGDPFAQA